ncbi:MAG TPA: CHASE3 domain-containing protein [Burkholderiaceae bacterium]|nr:CHASE3 domain-containing protein [Burkholderiaceae bacterium]
MTMKITDSLHRLVRLRWIVPLVAVVALGFVLVNELSYRQAMRGIVSADEILLQRAEVRRLQLLLQAAEAGQRGYLLTGQREYREPYERAQAQLEAQIARIKAMFADDPGTRGPLGEIEDLARRKMSELRTTVDLFDTGSVVGALEVVKTGIGRDHMRALDRHIDDMVAQEDIKLAYARRDLVNTLFVGRIGIATLVVAGMLLLAWAVRQSRSLSAAREEQRAHLQHERDRLEHEVERRTRDLTELARHLQSVREDERGRLARELHDELGGLLTAAKLDIARVKSRLKGATPETLERIDHLASSLDAGIALKRRIIEDLQPSSLTNLGLTAALEALCDEFARRVEVTMDTAFDEVDLADDVRLTAYRVVQEALTNVAKYAKARRVDVRLTDTNPFAEIRVGDDGIGFDTACVPQIARGLAGLRFRVASHGGRFDVTSTPGRGTTIAVLLPQRTASQDGAPIVSL